MKDSSYYRDLLLKTRSVRQWERAGMRARSGIAVPLFSVFSHDSIGIGEIMDLKLIVDWCAETDNTIIQLLPMNAVGAHSCPYDSISSFALEPVYMSLEGVGKKSKKKQQLLGQLRKEFPTGPGFVDYGIKDRKMEVLWELYRQADDVDSDDFTAFCDEQAYWLDDFALYKVLKYINEGRPWYDWDESLRTRRASALEQVAAEHGEAIVFQQWVQWHLWRQFIAVKQYAGKKGVLLKGDIPILVSRDSADVWAHPDYFKLDLSAGAPPDMYASHGQRWGMPTNNWDAIAADDYRYLREKLRCAAKVYDIIRVDHVVGLFRIWSIPVDEPHESQGLNGFFDPVDESKWGDQGRGILSVMLDTTDMLLCAEDLGTVPDVCRQVMEEYGIPGNDVQRWTKDWSERHDFLPPEEYRPLSVAMLSTHDTTNWAAWWRYEAGTVDEGLFRRKSEEKGIDFEAVKPLLFDVKRSAHGRLRWKDEVSSVSMMIDILGRASHEIADFIDMYLNTYEEKGKLWRQLGFKGKVKEKADRNLIGAVIRHTAQSQALFCIEQLMDWVMYAGLIPGDPYDFRINRPGTVGERNWSQRLPVALEDLVRDPVNAEIKKLIKSTGR